MDVQTPVRAGLTQMIANILTGGIASSLEEDGLQIHALSIIGIP